MNKQVTSERWQKLTGYGMVAPSGRGSEEAPQDVPCELGPVCEEGARQQQETAFQGGGTGRSFEVRMSRQIRKKEAWF